MIRIVFCDDEKRDIEKYLGYLENIRNMDGIELEICVYSNAEYLISNNEDWINRTEILILDIEMGKYNGVNVAEVLRKKGFAGEIIFLTISKAYVFDAFDVSPIQYILKNEDDFYEFYNKFIKVLNRIGEQCVKMFNYQVGSEVLVMPVKRIVSFEVKKRIIIMDYITQNQCFKTAEFYMTLSCVEEKIKMTNFIKVHRSFIVNPEFINKFSKKELEMMNKKVIPVSRSFSDILKCKFCEFLERKGVTVD